MESLHNFIYLNDLIQIKKYFLLHLLKIIERSRSIILALTFVFIFDSLSASLAQVIEDKTVNTKVDFNNQTYTINGGIISGKNLFQSFEEFNIFKGQEVFFNNPFTTENIIARVTGTSKSNIDGLIRANCCANLFFINPNGVIFGSNATLSIGGSFFSSTANDIAFSDGSLFSASSSQSSDVLSVSIPSGLYFRTNPNSILVQGLGHNVEADLRVLVNSGLKVEKGQTLALIGGDVDLQGGILSASSGKVEIGSVNFGLVTLNSTSQGWGLSYDMVQTFRDITLSSKSLIDASSSDVGNVNIRGKNITLNDGSLIDIENSGFQNGTSINIKATESINLIGSTRTSTGQLVPSAIFIRNIASGSGGDISVSAQNLLLKEGGAIRTYSVGVKKGGNINISVSDSIQLIDSLGLQDQSQISTESSGYGGAGDLKLSTQYLKLLDGGAVGSQTFGMGDSGDVYVKASEAILLSGAKFGLVTTISSVTGGEGNSGELTVDTRKLEIFDGASINTSTFSKGKAGTLTVNASDSVLLSGFSTNFSKDFIVRSALASAARYIPFFTGDDQPTGSTGNLIVNAPKINIVDGARINVSHDGNGNAGNISINTASVSLDRGARIVAQTNSAVGGNININVKDGILLLRNNSFISANSEGIGDGGNIKIEVPLLVAFPQENSDIIANSLSGSGGRVDINTNAVLGFDVRSREELQQLLNTNDLRKLDPRLLSSNDITAISQSSPSLNGQVTINFQGVDPSKNLVKLPTTVIDPTTLVAQNPCKSASSSEFTRSGRGGLPPSLSQDLSSQNTQVGLVEPTNLSASNPEPKTISKQTTSQPLSSSQIAPARGWVYNDKGEVVLVAYNSAITGPQRLQSNPKGCPVL